MLNGNIDQSKSKTPEKRIWDPTTSAVEKAPNEIILGLGEPAIMETSHWHAQIEINYVVKGAVRYVMNDGQFDLGNGDVAVFWGGQPHRITDIDHGTLLEAIHLPLLQFFRLRLPDDMRTRLMHGAVLTMDTPEPEDAHSFARWCRYYRSGDERCIRQATEELLLRIERIALGGYSLTETTEARDGLVEAPDQRSFDKIRQICEFVSDHFREEIDATAIAGSADIHPKYAMSVFKKSTGVSLNQYVQLLRLSYAQSLLLKDGSNVLDVAMESGFGSLSQFNKVFRKHAGINPSEFKRRAGERLSA
ncbi:helix-turn-helix domain-containing protein [Jannaschia sp. M317]|uniref:helix-turn-helix domain-containing protein n=1 Tax=Jannaschia sp. M317 TaxID=2867011 RepID=UPI0021A659A4|nr:helix-turn-helix domain-containing protein [Jannaschia sp. M317]UWQ17229.1 helix-turn-helix domain-containing protein [Jannaschia sp. M317]